MAGSGLTRSSTPVIEAIAELRAGRMVLLRDDSERRGEGDLLIAAEAADAEAINFMATEARGLVWLALSTERCAALGLEQIRSATAATSPRSATRRWSRSRPARASPLGSRRRPRPHDRRRGRPGLGSRGPRPARARLHLRARPGGVLERAGRTEAAVELAGLAGLRGAGVLCQVMRQDDHMATGSDLDEFAVRHGLAIVDVSGVLAHRRAAQPDAAARLAETGRLMRDVVGHFATGVTARGVDGAPVGTTANAISSVSLDPPLLVACLARSSETLEAVRAEGRFGVNILAAEQRHHSDRFARKGEAVGAHEVSCHDHNLGVPTLPGALATIACEVEAIHPAGDHEIVVGLARNLEHREPGAKPLLFYRGAYSRIEIEEDELAA